MRMRMWSLLLVLGAALAAASAGAQHHPVAPAVTAPAQHGGQAARAELGSGVAFAPDGSLWLVGVNAQGGLFVQTAPASDLQQWSAPRVQGTQGDAIAADGENRPKIAFGPNGWVVISYAKPLVKPYTAFVRMLRSTDGGQTFGAPYTVHADRHEITHRFDSIAFDALGASPGAQSQAPSATPLRATLDDWHISACPHQGPALVAAAQGGFHAVWFGVRQDGGTPVAAVRYGRLQADGSPVPDSVQALPDAGAEHADLQATGQQVAVVWRSFDAGRTSLKAWLSSDGGRTFALLTLGDVAGPNDFPRLVQQGQRMAAVWRTATEVQVHELIF